MKREDLYVSKWDCTMYLKERKRKMLEKVKKRGRRITAFILSLLTMISMVSSSAATALAADGTLYFNSGENIPYGTYSTTRMTFDGANTAYCLEPSKKHPLRGAISIIIYRQDLRSEKHFII